MGLVNSSPAYPEYRGKPNTRSMFYLPDSFNVIQLSSAYNSYPSWSEYVSSAPADLLVVGFAWYALNTNTPATTCDIGIATGPAGSEQVLMDFTVDMTYSGYGRGDTIMFPIPAKVNSGQRVVARSRNSYGSLSFYSRILVVQASALETF